MNDDKQIIIANNYVKPYSPVRIKGKQEENTFTLTDRWLGKMPAELIIELPKVQNFNYVRLDNITVLGWSQTLDNTNNRFRCSYRTSAEDYWRYVGHETFWGKHVRECYFPLVEGKFLKIEFLEGLQSNIGVASVARLYLEYDAKYITLLTNIIPMVGKLIEEFDPDCFEYTIKVGYTIKKISFIAIAQEEEGCISINNEILESGEESKGIPLEIGKKNICIKKLPYGVKTASFYQIEVMRLKYTYLELIQLTFVGRKFKDQKKWVITEEDKKNIEDNSECKVRYEVSTKAAKVIIKATMIDPSYKMLIDGDEVFSDMPCELSIVSAIQEVVITVQNSTIETIAYKIEIVRI